MASTTIRIDTDTHARLVELSAAAGSTLTITVRDAAEALRRQRFAHQVVDELANLSEDAEAWSAYVAEGDATSVRDGIG